MAGLIPNGVFSLRLCGDRGTEGGLFGSGLGKFQEWVSLDGWE